MEVLRVTIVFHILFFSQASNSTSDNAQEGSSVSDEDGGLVNQNETWIPRLTEVCSGILVVPHQNTTIPVKFHQQDSENVMKQVCKSLGCGGLFKLKENGTAPHACLTNCIYKNSKLLSCTEAAQSECNNVTEVVCEHDVVRLDGGKNRCEGRVELLLNGFWGTVCDDEWSLESGAVVCAQLDCGTALSVTGEGSEFGAGSGRVHVNGLNCTGAERNLWECEDLRLGNNTYYCGHKEDSGVVCSGSTTAPLTNNITAETKATTTGTTEFTVLVPQTSQSGVSAAILGCIFLTIALVLLLLSNATHCLLRRKRRACVIHQRQSNSHTSIASEQQRERTDSVNLLGVTTQASGCSDEHVNRREEREESTDSSCGSDYEPHWPTLPHYVQQNLYVHPSTEGANSSQAYEGNFCDIPSEKNTAVNTGDNADSESTSSGECYVNRPSHETLDEVNTFDPEETASTHSFQNVNSFPQTGDHNVSDSDSTSSGECYENTGLAVDMLLKSAEESPPLPEQLEQIPVNHYNSLPGQNSQSYHPSYTHNQDDNSTSSEDAYENVPDIDEEETHSSQSSSDGDYDDIADYSHYLRSEN